MKKIILLLSLLFIPLSFAGHHEEADTQIIFTINLDVVEGKAESLKMLLDSMVPAVKASEPNTILFSTLCLLTVKK